MSAGKILEDSNGADAAAAKNTTKRLYPKTHANYWKARLEHRTYTRDDKTFEVAEWSVRIHFNGVRKSFDLETANKEEAAGKARDIYLSILAKGWSATIKELIPEKMQPIETNSHSATVGEFLAEVERTANLNPVTFRIYAQAMRQLVAHIAGAQKDVSKYDYRRGGLTTWRKLVDSTLLSAITPPVVADWKIARLQRAGNDPRRKLEINRSFNSWLRNTKSLFSEAIICKPNFRIKVPKFKVPDGQRGEREVYWFETIEFERPGSMKFQAPVGITYESLVIKARQELRATSPEAYKLFLLCLCAGLRRGEADVCLWSQLNPEDNSIRIEANQFIEPKHGSGGTVYVDQSLMKELVSFKESGQNGFVINSPLDWKASTYRRYRCKPHWEALTEWLEVNGINARKKVHELRKIFGDEIVKRNGIFAGSAQLRHSTIQMTASHYTDPRQRAALPLANLLSDEGSKIRSDAPSQNQESKDMAISNNRKMGIKNRI